MCRMITRSQRKTKTLEKIQNTNNEFTKLQNVQDIVTIKSKKPIKKLPRESTCRVITRSQNKANNLKELPNVNNDSTISQNVQDIVPIKSKKPVKKLACKYTRREITQSQNKAIILKGLQNVINDSTERQNVSNDSTKSQNVQDIVTIKSKKPIKKLPRESMCRVITRLQNKANILKKLQDINNDSTKSQNVQDIVPIKSKKTVKKLACKYTRREITQSQNKAKILKGLQNVINDATERQNVSNDSIKSQNVQDIVTIKSKKPIKKLPRESMCRVITRLQNKANILKELQNVSNITAKSQNVQDIVNIKSKKPIQKLACEYTRGVIKQSQNNAKILKGQQNVINDSIKLQNVSNDSIKLQNITNDSTELQDVTNDSAEIQNVQDIVTAKTGKRITKFVCDYPGCSAIYDRPFRLERHIRSHTGERPYKCEYPLCDKSYIASSHLKRHVETHNHVRKGLQCNQCFLIVSNFHNLTRHYKRVHNNPLRCTECYAQFKKKNHLALHMNLHLGITTYKCSQCNKTFVNPIRLQRHEKYHEPKTYYCTAPGCSEVFDKWSLLRKHKVQHNVFKCQICGKEYKRGTTLRVHSKAHTEHTFLCPYDTCNRKYKIKYSLQDHIKRCHLNQKFVCDICKSQFTAKHSLQKHILSIHMGIEVRKRKPKKSERKRRKDAGIPRKSMVTMLAGLRFVHHTDQELLKRENVIELTV